MNPRLKAWASADFFPGQKHTIWLKNIEKDIIFLEKSQKHNLFPSPADVRPRLKGSNMVIEGIKTCMTSSMDKPEGLKKQWLSSCHLKVYESLKHPIEVFSEKNAAKNES